jgi:hypothetical protein
MVAEWRSGGFAEPTASVTGRLPVFSVDMKNLGAFPDRWLSLGGSGGQQAQTILFTEEKGPS